MFVKYFHLETQNSFSWRFFTIIPKHGAKKHLLNDRRYNLNIFHVSQEELDWIREGKCSTSTTTMTTVEPALLAGWEPVQPSYHQTLPHYMSVELWGNVCIWSSAMSVLLQIIHHWDSSADLLSHFTSRLQSVSLHQPDITNNHLETLITSTPCPVLSQITTIWPSTDNICPLKSLQSTFLNLLNIYELDEKNGWRDSPTCFIWMEVRFEPSV